MKIEVEEIKLYGGDVTILYYPNSHRYKLKETGEWLRSASKIANMYEPFDGKDWALKMCKEKFTELIDSHNDEAISKPDLFEKFMKALKSADDYTEYTQEIGKKIHKLCEEFANAKTKEEKDIVIGYLPSFEAEVVNGFWNFADWYAKQENVEFLKSEKLVYSKKYNIVGRLDCIAKVNGTVTLLDYKTGSLQPKKHRIQNSIYRMCHNEEMTYLVENKKDIRTEYMIDQGLILHLPREGKSEEHIAIDNNAYIVDIMCVQNLIEVDNYKKLK